MKQLVWDKTLSVEVDEIDEDHRRLVELFNLFREAVEASEPLEYRNALLDEMIACTVWHFRHEERLMLRYDYAEYDDHQREHQELVDSALAFQTKTLQARGLVSDADFDFLEHWLTEHIYTADMRLGNYLNTVM